MSTTAALVVSVVAALLIVSAFGKPVRTAVSGWIVRDKKTGQLRIAITPAKKRKKKARKKR